MWDRILSSTAFTVLLLAAARPGAAQVLTSESSASPATARAVTDTKLSLVPQTLPVPPELVLGPHDQPKPADLTLKGKLELYPTPATDLSFLDTIGRIIDAQDVYWPLGTGTTAHFQFQTDEGIGHWVPFLSLLQDADEIDAHVRNGVGIGATYRFNKDFRVDIEAQALESSGDSNPAISSESRVSVVFTLKF